MNERDERASERMGGSSRSDLGAELRSMRGTLAFAGFMVAVVAIPVIAVAVWVVREIDNLRGEVREMSEIAARLEGALTTLSISSDRVFEAASATEGRIDGLIGVLAREDALEAGFGLAAWRDLEQILPGDVQDVILSEPVRDGIRYTRFSGEPRLFVSLSVFDLMTPDQQALILEAVPLAGVRVEIVDAEFGPPSAVRMIGTDRRVPPTPSRRVMPDESFRDGFRGHASHPSRSRQSESGRSVRDRSW